jgi:hypothetical protein
METVRGTACASDWGQVNRDHVAVIQVELVREGLPW